MKQLQDNNGDCVHIAIGYWLCFKQYIHRVRKKKIQQIFVHNFNKFKYIIVILVSKIKLVMQNYQYNFCPPHLISVGTLPCKIKRSRYYYSARLRRTKCKKTAAFIKQAAVRVVNNSNKNCSQNARVRNSVRNGILNDFTITSSSGSAVPVVMVHFVVFQLLGVSR